MKKERFVFKDNHEKQAKTTQKQTGGAPRRRQKAKSAPRGGESPAAQPRLVVVGLEKQLAK